LKKHILFIAGEFPPYKTIGRIRTVKWCTHLNHIGWKSSVLTLPYEETIAAFDYRTLDEIPEQTRVYRASWPRPKDWMISAVKSVLKKFDKGQIKYNTTPTTKNTPYHHKSGFSIGDLMGMIDRFSRYYLLVPDDYLLWTLPALYKGLKIVHETRPDVIFATAPPFSGLMVGSVLSRITGIPWVADYRDLWTGDVLREWVPGWRQKLELGMEQCFLKNTSAVVTVSTPKTLTMKDRISFLDEPVFHTITNGYDPEEYQTIKPFGSREGIIRFVYTGRLFKNRKGYELLEALGLFNQKFPEKKNLFKIEYYGGVSNEIHERMKMIIAAYGLQQNVDFHSDVSYSQSKAVQKGADILLLIVDTGETTSGVLPGKLFEYIAAGRPILCIAKDGAASEIINQGNLGWCVNPGDTASIASLFEKISEIDLDPFPEKIDIKYLSQFNRKLLAEKLSNILCSIIAEP